MTEKIGSLRISSLHQFFGRTYNRRFDAPFRIDSLHKPFDFSASDVGAVPRNQV